MDTTNFVMVGILSPQDLFIPYIGVPYVWKCIKKIRRYVWRDFLISDHAGPYPLSFVGDSPHCRVDRWNSKE